MWVGGWVADKVCRFGLRLLRKAGSKRDGEPGCWEGKKVGGAKIGGNRRGVWVWVWVWVWVRGMDMDNGAVI